MIRGAWNIRVLPAGRVLGFSADQGADGTGGRLELMGVQKITVVCRNPRHLMVQKLLTLLCVQPDQPGNVHGEMSWSAVTQLRSSVRGRDYAGHGGSADIKIVFECIRCGDNFMASNKKKLDTVLTKFWEINVSELPLDVLRDSYDR